VSVDISQDENATGSDTVTFGELLTGPASPSLDLLERVKSFAKFCKSRADGPLPAPVASAIYFATIVRARTACGVNLSALDDRVLIEGVRWSLAQPWLQGAIRELLNAWEAGRPPDAQLP
jgi:hypothetical protein